MKTLLLASTALVGMVGAAAAAEIKLSGYAEIGINGGNGIPGTPYETQFHNDWQVNFDFSGAMDSGVEFGGRVQIEETNSPGAIDGGLKIDDEAFWVSGTFGKVTLGETKGAIDWAVPDVYSGTGISDDHSTHAGAYWNTGLDGQYDDQILRYEYSFGDFGVALSAEMDDTGVQDTIWGLGGKWSGQLSGLDVSAGLGYQSNGGADTVSIGASAAMSNGLSFALGYAQFNSDTAPGGIVFDTGDFVSGATQVDNWMGVGIAYTTGALTVGANYSVYSAELAGVQDPSGWGLVANYDLGGGAVAMASYGASDNGVSGNGHGDETWSIGLGLSF
jgi:outer membrane protein OmpU